MGVPSGYVKKGSATISKEGVVGSIWTAIENVPPGTLGIVELSGIPSLLGPIMDGWGAEQVVQGVFDVAGVDAGVDDCYWENGKGYIEFTGSPFALVPFLYALGAAAAALAILGAVITVAVFIFSFIQEPGKFILPFLVIGGLVIVGMYVAGLAGRGRSP